ncbi:hypothetical protein CC80DRAFT_567144 [Byssothecium circinans]|uniref:Uncharacterized protein n=1 Tax=Byssothecium circinans TaxID=147558 RepID=A0A6A5TNV4_9PLEO|nr:hypothetical protein CC80DRAFT_567144 [Byssothecium circinans]
MGITLSHTAYAPLALISAIIGFISFAFTLATFLNVFWSYLLTIKAAPREIEDYLSNLEQALIEERRHLRKVRKRARGATKAGERSRSRSRFDDRRERGSKWGGGGGGGSGGDKGGERGGIGVGGRYKYFSRDEQAFRSRGAEESLRVVRTAVRNMIRAFRQIEYLFLKPEFQNTDSANW